MKLIQLNNGKNAIVDDDDFDFLDQWKWHQHPSGYAVRKPWDSINKKSLNNVYMHRVIAKTQKGMLTDHVNGNKIDNRKCNLRPATHSQNLQNKPVRRDSQSGVKGVCKSMGCENRWNSKIKVNGELIYLGSFGSKDEAGEAYRLASIKYFGEFAHRPEDDESGRLICRQRLGLV